MVQKNLKMRVRVIKTELLIGILFCLIVTFSDGYRILSVFLISGRSNMNYFDPIHLELAKKGHQVTVITPTPSLVKHENIQEFPGLDFSAMVQGMVGRGNFFEMRLAGERMGTPFFSMASQFAENCHRFHELPVVKQVIGGKLGDFDLVMTMAFMNECVYGIIDRLNASSVIISTVPTMPWFTGVIGTPTPLSFVPHIYFAAAQSMGFPERVGNVLTFVFQVVTRTWVYLPEIEKAYRKHLPNAPGVNEVLKNTSLIFGAGHSSFGPLRPSMPDLIDDIGGIHCRPGKELPVEVKQMILEGGEEKDFVFFSLGSVVKGHQVPSEMRKGILKAFEKFPEYRILWKWEQEDMEGLPGNVKIAKWFPQQDLLASGRCKLFITHGGLSSLHEAVYHGVPVIGIPFFGDQDWNMRQVEEMGIGRKLELSEMSERTLTELIRELLNNPK